jgi:hypothetical protein
MRSHGTRIQSLGIIKIARKLPRLNIWGFGSPSALCAPNPINEHLTAASFLVAASLVALVGCESEDAKGCREKYFHAHGLINGPDTKSVENVESALEAVESALPLCKKANMHKEVAELEKAQRTLQSNASSLRAQASRKELTPEELEKVLKDGDPGCPKGQSYSYKKTGKVVKCIGPQVVSMTRGQAEEHFKNRGFRVKAEGSILDAEFGPESYHYEFSGSDANAKPQCLKVLATPGMSWEESVSRIAGVNPALLKKGATVRAEDGSKWPLTHIENEKQTAYMLGKCGP